MGYAMQSPRKKKSGPWGVPWGLHSAEVQRDFAGLGNLTLELGGHRLIIHTPFFPGVCPTLGTLPSRCEVFFF